MFVKVFGNWDILSLEVEFHADGTVVKIYIINSIRASVTPVSNDNLVLVLFSHFLHVNIVFMVVLFDIINSIKARTCAHEFKDTVHTEHSSKLALDGSSLETSPDLEASFVDDDGVLHIEKAGGFTDLFEIGFSEGLFDDNV